jgi:Zn-dependent protease
MIEPSFPPLSDPAPALEPGGPGPWATAYGDEPHRALTVDPLHGGQDGDPFGRPRQSFYRRRIAPIGAALLALLTKIKALLLVLGNIKFVVTAGSMAVSVAAYATIWGVPFAIGFVILLLVHETGHVIALRREGIKASAPMFIPFLGAVISARSLGDNALAEARVGLAGPILGSIGAGACLVIWKLTGDDFWRALAFTGLFLNLFNLLPVVPLDGGRAMAAMTPWMWLIGFVAMVVLAFVFPNPIIWIIVLFAGMETYKRFKTRRAGGAAQATYYRVAGRNRAIVATVYLSLIALLVIGMSATNLPRPL